jgi:hypothetical protein
VAGRIGYGSGAPVELPPRWNESEFDQRLSRYDFAGNGARYANGQPAQKADVLANYQLLLDHAAPDGTHFYKLVDRAGRPLIRSGGHVFWLPVPQGPADACADPLFPARRHTQRCRACAAATGCGLDGWDFRIVSGIGL